MILKSNVRPAEGFGAKEYNEAFENGELGTMHFECSDRDELNALRRRILSAASVRYHIIQTTAGYLERQGIHLLTVTYKGTLPPPYLRP